MEEEVVYGGDAVRRLYATRAGAALERVLLSRRFVSRLIGLYYGSRWSRGKIPGFIRSLSIDMEPFEGGPYSSFNDFFIRKFKRGARPFDSAPDRFPAFAEARYLAFESVGPDLRFPVKGEWMTAPAVVGRPPGRPEANLGRLEGGPMLLARLCPADYHRYHYPVSGRTAAAWIVPGPLHSVNPIALAALGTVFRENRRRVAILETDRFGLLAYVEVGAIGVGKIVQTWEESRPFARGDEKGYFLFGGSTVMVFGEPGRWRPSADLLERTSRRVETLVRLGETVGRQL